MSPMWPVSATLLVRQKVLSTTRAKSSCLWKARTRHFLQSQANSFINSLNLLMVMWIGHFKVWHENCIYLSNASKCNVVISMYPLTSYIEGKYRYHTNINILTGKQKDIERFITEIRKDKRCIEFRGKGNVYLSYIRLESSDYHTTNYYTPKIFFLKPIVHKDGKEDWYFGAWEKETITEMFQTF